LDLASVLQSLLNLFAGIAVAVSIAVIIIGTILRARGDPRANNAMLYGFVGLLVALLGWPLVRWVFSGYTISALARCPRKCLERSCLRLVSDDGCSLSGIHSAREG
jgi:hypothetical protein